MIIDFDMFFSNPEGMSCFRESMTSLRDCFRVFLKTIIIPSLRDCRLRKVSQQFDYSCHQHPQGKRADGLRKFGRRSCQLGYARSDRSRYTLKREPVRHPANDETFLQYPGGHH